LQRCNSHCSAARQPLLRCATRSLCCCSRLARARHGRKRAAAKTIRQFLIDQSQDRLLWDAIR
jgi:hypothetical protein